MIYLAGMMGLRFGEVAALQLGDLRQDPDQIRVARAVSEISGVVEAGPPKTAASVRTLDLPPQLQDEIARHVEQMNTTAPSALLFSDAAGGPLRRSNFRGRIFAPAVERAGLTGLTFHGLRHSAATTWMAAGADARTVQHMLGHSDPRLVLKLDAHVADEAVRRGGELAAGLYWDTAR